MPRKSNLSQMSREEFIDTRKRLTLKPRELAELLGCSESTIRNIEQEGGYAKRPSRTLARLLKVLGYHEGRKLIENIVRQEKMQGE